MDGYGSVVKLVLQQGEEKGFKPEVYALDLSPVQNERAKENNNLNKYPEATNFQELKTQPNLKYGDSNYIKYTSSGESSSTLEYLDKTTNQWIKPEVTG